MLLPKQTTSRFVLHSHLCDFCDRKFSKKSFLRRHRFLCHSQQPFECSECGVDFLRKKLLITHFKQNHHENIQKKIGHLLGTSHNEEKLKVKGKPRNKCHKNKLDDKFSER